MYTDFRRCIRVLRSCGRRIEPNLQPTCAQAFTSTSKRSGEWFKFKRRLVPKKKMMVFGVANNYSQSKPAYTNKSSRHWSRICVGETNGQEKNETQVE
ncbi:hypothetical protein QVD17_30990 [Tagetes erecta]|uniref:Uncharacterized protein n=1 Tax=Tagetes erecta TaxID=13708 RepID=A0AAD8NNG1_TARER|nr:hypothetical protein QVD17_30990 [Tagetes erecta]